MNYARLPRAIFLLSLFGWACSESDPAAIEDAGSGGNGTGASSTAAGGRGGLGGDDSPASGGDSAEGSGGRRGGRPGSGGSSSAVGGDSTAAGGETSGSGGRRGAGGAASGAGGAGSGAAGGESSGSGGGSSVSCDDKPNRSRGYRTIEVDGVSRDYYLIPAKTKGKPVPLVLGFHAYGGKGEWDVGTFSFDYASEGNAVLMYPDGLDQGGATGWETRGNDNADLRLVRRLIDEAKADHCIDESKIFAIGFSWGGWMATQTACALGDQIRAFISIAGGGPSGATCQGPVSGMIVHGTNDQSEKISSGRSTLTRFLTENGCGMDTSTVFDGACQAYSGCDKDTLWCEHPGEHIIPDYIYRIGWQFLMSAP